MSRHDTVSVVKIVRHGGDDDSVFHGHSVSGGGTPEPLDGIFIQTPSGLYREPQGADADPRPSVVFYDLPPDLAAQREQADAMGLSFYDPAENGNV